jgi:hypothetical protein|tara:strand:- start:630 stop:890 length:261 start_codon:yes stop_codon:yes gene_type:complete
MAVAKTSDSTPFTVTTTEPSVADASTFFTPDIPVKVLVILRSHPPQSIPDTLNSTVVALEKNPMIKRNMPHILNAMVDRWVAVTVA